MMMPMKESNFWNGTVHPSVRSHGLAKKTVYALSQFYRTENNLDSVCLCMNSIYGGNSSWNRPDTLKVLEALVKKFIDARNNNIPIVNLSGTGEVYREFLHADDAAEAILLAIDYNEPELLNISSGADISVKKLAEGIKLAVGYTGDIVWGDSREDGQYRKLLSDEKMLGKLKWSPRIPLVEGLQQTIDSYENFLKEKTNANFALRS